MLRSLLLCALLLPLVGCGSEDPNTPPLGNPDNGDPTKVTYAESLNVDLAAMTLLPSGLYLQDLGEPGAGDAATAGRRVYVHYTGWLPDGQKFDSSEGKSPLDFILGQGRVIDGWDQGIAGMRVGGKRRLVIPSSLAYGAEGSPGAIPSYSVLIFDTELIVVR
ncbi:FKBP-type peptidyl-prolyl cis-trans isomerase [Myxococcus sp. CA051A]|uniref:Peptidyl-prolyl cis-trans isomerase n=1 Tax=Myxococcus llanfairpwllgwyngyllgogerychwyrndrobwllllantysiliogogogochensis TaxID=2590453 RepID=A0A540WUE9_9BACT|nr:MULTISPECIES: FKBP-type peptidyl-prolyl cis-trans isomerase [Myxococcus]NTX02262.1 FKBP-type peptidyl-prolyl cis-trans isomerase [Myxococcus sp. CA040A]NTX17573.1 FKBP-type peptidyl-prolyl cis-trans isomerase [Myxococcus sp. CA056]NTX64021.1 FKBP-type peptidyl-prolyl cis-trans isomerase [Myxococcus sp. CA051A]TQF12641.1 FKBP-type peptidyl-prolyl cis-trans isomerase [Myxococcus llanfairpwllgwyngyllgogerychwyrndrobwllllantysiliogogogochensis]